MRLLEFRLTVKLHQSLARRLSSLLPLITLGLVRLGALSLTGYHHVVTINCSDTKITCYIDQNHNFVASYSCSGTILVERNNVLPGD